MKIFVSYRKTDVEKVQELISDLETLEHTVWYDKEIRPGHNWWGAILENIRNCDLFVVAVSPEMLQSEPCRNEYTYAHSLHKRILPVIIKPISANALPPEFVSIQHIEYSQMGSKLAYKALLKALTELPPARPLPSPLPTPPAEPVSELNILLDRARAAKLNDDEQAALVFRIKQFLLQPKYAEDAREALRLLRSRPDLLSSVRDEIDDVLRRHGTASRPQQDAHRSATAGSAGFDNLGNVIRGVSGKLDDWISGQPPSSTPTPAAATAGVGAGGGAGAAASRRAPINTTVTTAPAFNMVALVVGCVTAFMFLFGVAHLITGKRGQAIRAFGLGIGWFVVFVFLSYALSSAACVVGIVHLALVAHVSWRGSLVTA